MKVTPREWINARAEKIGTQPYAESFRLRRSLIRVSGLYDWRMTPSGRRAPHWIGMKDRAPFALAGIWKEITNAKTGELLDAYVVITCAANALVEQLHDRMPLIIDTPTMADGSRPISRRLICRRQARGATAD
jgi:putative SOS response-associated peptidase YedK